MKWTSSQVSSPSSHISPYSLCSKHKAMKDKVWKEKTNLKRYRQTQKEEKISFWITQSSEEGWSHGLAGHSRKEPGSFGVTEAKCPRKGWWKQANCPKTGSDSPRRCRMREVGPRLPTRNWSRFCEWLCNVLILTVGQETPGNHHKPGCGLRVLGGRIHKAFQLDAREREQNKKPSVESEPANFPEYT